MAPATAAAALACIWAFGGYGLPSSPETQAYLDEVAAAIDRLPYKVGDWIGADVEVQPAAVRLLNPNRLLQRQYRDPATGRSVQVLVVHCGDTRDMVGHYPPVCYPAHGWIREGAERTEVRINGTSAPATEYRFRRSLGEVESEMVITNLFVLPLSASPTAPDMDALNAASQSLVRSSLGAAQVQIVTEADLTSKERSEIVDAFVAAMTPMIHAVALDSPRAQ